MNVKTDEKFGTHKSHQEHYEEEDPLDIRASREPFSTPIKANKFVYTYSGILSATEQVSGSFRRLNGNGDKLNNL